MSLRAQSAAVFPSTVQITRPLPTLAITVAQPVVMNVATPIGTGPELVRLLAEVVPELTLPSSSIGSNLWGRISTSANARFLMFYLPTPRRSPPLEVGAVAVRKRVILTKTT